MEENKNSQKGGTNGSVADTSASDLERGYSKCEDEKQSHMSYEDESPMLNGGFAGRPKGWER